MVPDFRAARLRNPALVLGSMLVTGIAILLAIPLGIGAAIYIAEIARAGSRRS